MNARFSIREEILKKSERCCSNFSCLHGSTECLCEATDMVNDRVLFVNPKNRIPCDYLMFFGNSYICNCPTRKAIFMKYERKSMNAHSPPLHHT